MAELDTFAKLITAVHEILPDAIIEEQHGELVIYPGLKEVGGKIVSTSEEDTDGWVNTEKFDNWLKGN